MRFASQTERAQFTRSLADVDAWQKPAQEAAIDPDLPIIDCHHHFYNLPAKTYLMPDLAHDVGAGHNIRATVYIECNSHYREGGDLEMRPVGETEFVIARTGAKDAPLKDRNICAGIVGYADLRGDRVEDVLRAHVAAGQGRFRGIRARAQNEPSLSWFPQEPKGLLRDAKFREGFKKLRDFDLSFDVWQFFFQIAEVEDLARAFPAQPIQLNHFGGVLGVGIYENKRDEVFATWKRAITSLAKCPNVSVKIGGLGMAISGFPYVLEDRPASSDVMAQAWRPYIETCIELFGVKRCMFESNFPADKQVCSYCNLWNAFKKVTSACSATDKAALFHDNAKAFYRLDV